MEAKEKPVTTTVADTSASPQEDLQCIICLDAVDDPVHHAACQPAADTCSHTRCGGIFCGVCLGKWRREHNTCPHCRGPLENHISPITNAALLQKLELVPRHCSAYDLGCDVMVARCDLAKHLRHCDFHLKRRWYENEAIYRAQLQAKIQNLENQLRSLRLSQAPDSFGLKIPDFLKRTGRISAPPVELTAQRLRFSVAASVSENTLALFLQNESAMDIMFESWSLTILNHKNLPSKRTGSASGAANPVSVALCSGFCLSWREIPRADLTEENGFLKFGALFIEAHISISKVIVVAKPAS